MLMLFRKSFSGARMNRAGGRTVRASIGRSGRRTSTVLQRQRQPRHFPKLQFHDSHSAATNLVAYAIMLNFNQQKGVHP
jgi:hypothetical protein